MSGLPAAAIFPVRYAPATCTSASARLARQVEAPRPECSAGLVSSAVSSCGRCGCSQSPAAARSACSTTAPSAAGSLALIVIDPSSPTWTLTRRSAQLASSSVSDALRCAATNRSHCAAVIGPAISARSASVAVVAIRVSARTLAYDIRPAANSAVMRGRLARARATRTCSRAVPGATWHFHASHAAHDGRSHVAQPPRASNSATSWRKRHVPAARCAASSQIRSSSRSNGTSTGSGSCGPGSAGPSARKSSAALNRRLSLMYLMINGGSDISSNARSQNGVTGTRGGSRGVARGRRDQPVGARPGTASRSRPVSWAGGAALFGILNVTPRGRPARNTARGCRTETPWS